MVLLDSPVIMIPIDEFNENQKDMLYNYAITGHEGEVVMSSVLPSLNAVAVYSINKDLKLVIDDHFSDVRFAHVCESVWNHLYRRSFTGIRQKLYAYFTTRNSMCSAFSKTGLSLQTVLTPTLPPMPSILSSMYGNSSPLTISATSCIL